MDSFGESISNLLAKRFLVLYFRADFAREGFNNHIVVKGNPRSVGVGFYLFVKDFDLLRDTLQLSKTFQACILGVDKVAF